MRNGLGYAALLAILTTTACTKTSDYSPMEGNSGKEIFQAACAECHAKNDDGYYFELDEAMASNEAVAKKINAGGMLMPAFPNIGGESLSRVSQYVLDNSSKP